jgi:hypothetical protein
MRIPPVNWRRGFNRAFVVLAIGWVGYVLLVYPHLAQREALHKYGANLAQCNTEETQLLKEGEAYQLVATLHDLCEKQAGEAFNLQSKETSFRTWFKGWRSILGLLEILVLPPLVAYGLFRLGWFTLAWVQRGFRHAV